MREIVLDTETTGFDPEEGHRIVEIGAVELFNQMPTGATYHQYINPERDMPSGAFEVHGLSEAFLRDYPVFEKVADAFLAFVDGARLVIHNATFDMRFLNHELRLCGRPTLSDAMVLDTLAMARKRFPGSPASLDALCRRFGVDNSAREKHGALLDSEILAEVYLELIGGRQPDLVLEARPGSTGRGPGGRWTAPRRATPLPPRLTAEEEAAHRAFIEKMGEAAIWHRNKA
jgi:DNA polymerase III subunit epsilon